MFKAWRRKERKVKGVSRGRCFEKKQSDPVDSTNVSSIGTAKLTNIKITRANGSVEHRDTGE